MANHLGQTIALTTDDKVAMLRRAWSKVATEADTLLEALTDLLTDAQTQQEEDLSASASNSHSSSSNIPGSNTLTDQENVRAWNQILNAYKKTRFYLLNCARYAQDAFAIQRNGCFPNPLPARLPDNLAVILDPNAQWAQLCDLEEIPFTDVINMNVGDEAIYLWLLANPNLLNTSANPTEARAYYGAAIVGRAGGGF